MNVANLSTIMGANGTILSRNRRTDRRDQPNRYEETGANLDPGETGARSGPVKDTDVSFIMTRNERKKSKRWIGTCRGRERHEIPAIHDVSY